MFTWICPTCGREVPPSYDKCPDCAAKGIAGDTPPVAAQPPAAQAPAPAYVPSQPPPQYMPPPPRPGVPTWLLSILFAFAFVGLGAGVYWAVNYFRGGSAAASAPGETAPVKGPAKNNPLQKYVEVAGIRFVAAPKNEKEIEARFLLINHSGADITGLAGMVNIWGRTDKSEEESAGHFSFKVPSLGPFESKEATAPVTTKLKAYELPDWQNISTDVQITSP
jgi:hypothetical protein